jgi:hypothetical protein
MKRMEANFAKQTETLQQQNQAMQNKIVHLERQAQQKDFNQEGEVVGIDLKTST